MRMTLPETLKNESARDRDDDRRGGASLARKTQVQGGPMTTSSDTLLALVDRFDASAFDAPLGRARIRIVVGFIRGKHDTLVPIDFASQVRRTLPSARHLELDCGHVPQVERRFETHAAMVEFLRADVLDDYRSGPVSDAFG